MTQRVCDPVLLVANESELRPTRRIWGDGWWLDPEEREALDWLTLSRLLGWGVTLTRRTPLGFDAGLTGGSHWAVLACDPDSLGEDAVSQISSRLQDEPLVVIARAAEPEGAFARLAGAARRPEQVTGKALRWIGPGTERHWRCHNALDAIALECNDDTAIWGTLEGVPIIVARQVGSGIIATLAFHPSQARDNNGHVTALLKHLLIWSALQPLAWFDLAKTLVVRIDDPGSAHSAFKSDWYYPKLQEDQWFALGTELSKRYGRMSIGYVAGWVDDGDPLRGVLQVAGQAPHRLAGAVYPSPLITYEDRAGNAPGTLHDYTSEYRGIQALRQAGLGDVELHGYTHMHPDRAAWAKAPDRYKAKPWFRELGPHAEASLAALPPNQHPLVLGVKALQSHFHTYPTTLICPGDEWTDAALERALDLGLQLVGSYHLALRHEDCFCWCMHVVAPYLNQPGAAWFDTELPIVGYFHDREPALEGISWISTLLDQWQDAGAEQLMDYRELATIIGRRLWVDSNDGALHLTVMSHGAPALVRPITVCIRVPGGRLPSSISVLHDQAKQSLDVQQFKGNFGQVTLPLSAVEEEK